MSYSNRIWVYGPVGLLLLVIAFYSIYWRVQADALSAALDRANHGQIIPGIDFAFAEKTVGGFPFRVDAVLGGVTFAHRGPQGETAWRTEKLALHALSYRADRFIFETDGLQSFARPGNPGEAPNVTFVTPALSRASAILQRGKLMRFDIDLLQPQGKDATRGAGEKRTFTAARAQLHFLARPDNTVDVAMKIDNARIGGGYVPDAGDEIVLPLIDLRAKLTESQALDALKTGEANPLDAADAWRRSKGAIAVSDLVLNWPFAHATLKGDLVLDANNALTGILSGDGVEIDGKTPAAYGLVFANGAMRLVGRSGLELPVP